MSQQDLKFCHGPEEHRPLKGTRKALIWRLWRVSELSPIHSFFFYKGTNRIHFCWRLLQPARNAISKALVLCMSILRPNFSSVGSRSMLCQFKHVMQLPKQFPYPRSSGRQVKIPHRHFTTIKPCLILTYSLTAHFHGSVHHLARWLTLLWACRKYPLTHSGWPGVRTSSQLTGARGPMRVGNSVVLSIPLQSFGFWGDFMLLRASLA